MRTTVSIDLDVLVAAKERARQEGKTIGAVLSELARAGLTGAGDAANGLSDSFYGFEPFPSRGPAVSNALVDRLREGEPE